MPAHKIPIGQRLFSRVLARGSCWEWSGARDVDGYGVIKISKRMFRLHRFIYESLYGELPKDIQVCHRCDNPSCFRPSHLFPATAAENQHDKKKKGRQAKGNRTGFRIKPWIMKEGAIIGNWKKTHCPHGVPAPAFDCAPREAIRAIKREAHTKWRERTGR